MQRAVNLRTETTTIAFEEAFITEIVETELFSGVASMQIGSQLALLDNPYPV